jgi:hypothetical protein
MMKLVWNGADGHYDLTDQDEFLMAVAENDLIELLQNATKEAE